MEQETEIKKLINEEKYLVRDIRLKAKIYLILQALSLSGVIYLAFGLLDFVFDETRWLLLFIGVLLYLLGFAILTSRIAFKKQLQVEAAKKQLTFILVLAIIPGVIFLLVALSDIL